MLFEFKNKNEWIKQSLINIASSGRFSSDQSILAYAKDVWQAACLYPPSPSEERSNKEVENSLKHPETVFNDNSYSSKPLSQNF